MSILQSDGVFERLFEVKLNKKLYFVIIVNFINGWKINMFFYLFYFFFLSCIEYVDSLFVGDMKMNWWKRMMNI